MSSLSLWSSCRGNLYANVGLLTDIINWLTARENDKILIVFHFLEVERRKRFEIEIKLYFVYARVCFVYISEF